MDRRQRIAGGEASGNQTTPGHIFCSNDVTSDESATAVKEIEHTRSELHSSLLLSCTSSFSKGDEDLSLADEDDVGRRPSDEELSQEASLADEDDVARRPDVAGGIPSQAQSANGIPPEASTATTRRQGQSGAGSGMQGSIMGHPVGSQGGDARGDTCTASAPSASQHLDNQREGKAFSSGTPSAYPDHQREGGSASSSGTPSGYSHQARSTDGASSQPLSPSTSARGTAGIHMRASASAEVTMSRQRREGVVMSDESREGAQAQDRGYSEDIGDKTVERGYSEDIGDKTVDRGYSEDIGDKTVVVKGPYTDRELTRPQLRISSLSQSGGERGKGSNTPIMGTQTPLMGTQTPLMGTPAGTLSPGIGPSPRALTLEEQLALQDVSRYFSADTFLSPDPTFAVDQRFVRRSLSAADGDSREDRELSLLPSLVPRSFSRESESAVALSDSALVRVGSSSLLGERTLPLGVGVKVNERLGQSGGATSAADDPWSAREDSVTGGVMLGGVGGVPKVEGVEGVVNTVVERPTKEAQLSEWARDHPPAQDPAFQIPEFEERQTLGLQLWREVTGEAVEGASGSRGNAADGTTFDPKRERVYNTMFHVPWRVEMLIQLGYFVCLDSFLTLFTVLPLRILMLLTRIPTILISHQRMRADEMNDIARGLVLLVGFCVLQFADVSLIYHWIRGQSVIKLVVVFSVMEVLDKLCQTLGADVVQMLFNMTRAVASCPRRRLAVECFTLFVDECIALITFTIHSLVILCHAVTLNVAINSHNNMLLTILVSNNFAEVKGNVFKRFSKENVHKLACQDTVERFHLSCHLLFVAVQNIVKGQGASLNFFIRNIGTVLLCEIVVDGLKHTFLAKFNEIKPEAYSDYLQSLCRLILEHRSHHVHRTLSFVPLAPACVVARTLVPLLGLLPDSDQAHWMKPALTAGTVLIVFIALLLLKAAVGLGVHSYARWYLLRCLVKKDRGTHFHED